MGYGVGYRDIQLNVRVIVPLSKRHSGLKRRTRLATRERGRGVRVRTRRNDRTRQRSVRGDSYTNQASATQSLAMTVTQKMVRNGCLAVLCRKTRRATSDGRLGSRSLLVASVLRLKFVEVVGRGIAGSGRRSWSTRTAWGRRSRL
jgi:hypothetical protein